MENRNSNTVMVLLQMPGGKEEKVMMCNYKTEI